MTPQTLVLREYESRTVSLRDYEARVLAREAQGVLDVAPAHEPGRWRVTAGNLVGTLALPEMSILIRPKVGLANLLLLLDQGIAGHSWRAGSFAYDTRPDLLEAFVAFFARSLEELSARGLHRAYCQEEDRLLALRGRIDFASHIKRAALPAPIACIYDEYTLDITENRYLLGVAAHLLRVSALPATTRAVLLHAAARFEDVVPVLPTAADFDRLHLTRLNEHYRPTLSLARLVVENLTLVDEAGNHAAGTFLLDMNKVFEGFVTRRLRAALRGRLAVEDQTRLHLGRGQRIAIHPDLEFRYTSQTTFVGDVKYKLAPTGTARSADYFQLLAYCTVLGLSEGVLIYAQVDDGDAEAEIEVVNSGHRLTTYRLDLAGGPADIEASIDRLANWIAARAQPVPQRSGTVTDVCVPGLAPEPSDEPGVCIL